ncbi:uncharacterized protein BDZ99DRAFT_41744 [Mytilinidion resinicola]|uniref:Zn(2)-C6 fungal-type domain-containing protein n=1 Tax=Mytilinidion resinicola TaxID=574789 RepID=A0A6A6YJD5_9PEZI|nr:uncharacterized protein BDZ99DRAFT_41744 [Mytilinidion resinicola]KAF2808900.1 hypothetical protein BDZ99DRAFT_41744 [Mytilinidion resinicola]
MTVHHWHPPVSDAHRGDTMQLSVGDPSVWFEHQQSQPLNGEEDPNPYASTRQQQPSTAPLYLPPDAAPGLSAIPWAPSYATSLAQEAPGAPTGLASFPIDLPEQTFQQTGFTGVEYPGFQGDGYGFGAAPMYGHRGGDTLTMSVETSRDIEHHPINTFASLPFASHSPDFVSPPHPLQPPSFLRHQQYQPQPPICSQPDNDTSLMPTQHYIEHWSHANATGIPGHLANSAGSLSSTSWDVVSGMPSASNTPIQEKSSDSDDQEWVNVDGLRSSHTASHSPLHKVETATSYSPPFFPLQSPIQSISEEQTSSRPKLPKVASSFTQRATKSKVCKRKGKMSDEGRAKAAEMRKNGPCIRCRLYKLGCDGNNPCKRCLKVTDSARSFLEPCSRANLDSVSLVRHSNGRFNQVNVTFKNYRWINVDERCLRMDIQWNLPGCIPIRGSQIAVHFRTYREDPSNDLNTTTYHWQVGGSPQRVKTQPYAIYDTESLVKDVEIFIADNQAEMERWILNRSQSDPLTATTYEEAMRYRSSPGSSMITMALQMQCGAIMSQGFGSAINGDIRGIDEIDYRRFGECGYSAYDRNLDRPIPQAMGHQLDVAILKYINKVQKELLREIRRKIFQPGIKPWYELFLTFFILLSNLEYIHDGALGYLRSKRKTMLESQVSYVVKSQVQEWEVSAGVMLQYFRCVLRGFLPFQLARDNLDELIHQAKLDPTSVHYVTNAVHLLDQQRTSLAEKLNASPSTEINVSAKWIPQLFNEAYA